MGKLRVQAKHPDSYKIINWELFAQKTSLNLSVFLSSALVHKLYLEQSLFCGNTVKFRK